VIRGLPAQEFPLIPKLTKTSGVKFKASDLRKTIGQVAFSVSVSESRPELSGVACFFGGALGASTVVFVATDSYRLAERVLSGISGIQASKIIVPSRTMLELSRILGSTRDELGVPEEAEWQTTENQLVVTFGNTELISRLIEGSFPDYLQIIPDHFKITAIVDRTELQKAVKAASLFARQGLYDIHFNVKPSEGVLSVSSADQGTGKTATALTGEITGDQDVLLTVNFRYVNEGLSAISTPKVRILMNDAMSPMLILPTEDDEEKYRYLVMPIRQ
jgi:DNA polymerase-3 subunit beta